MVEEQHLKSLTGSMNAMQHVLEEAGRLLKLVWRVSVPAANAAGDGGNNQQVRRKRFRFNPFNYPQEMLIFS